MSAHHRGPSPWSPRWLAVAFIVVCLALQANAALVAGLFGARHSHAGLDAARDPMAGWRDFRREQHARAVVGADEAAAAHEFAHEMGMRHHHDFADSTVLKEDVSGSTESMPADGTQTGSGSLVLWREGGETTIASPALGRELVWRRAATLALPDPDPRRIERPPQAS